MPTPNEEVLKKELMHYLPHKRLAKEASHILLIFMFFVCLSYTQSAAVVTAFLWLGLLITVCFLLMALAMKHEWDKENHDNSNNSG